MTGHHSWGYGQADGPAEWHKAYPIAQGNRQSPIDIDSARAVYDPSLQPLVISYECCSSLSISNTGHSVMVEFEDTDDRTDMLHLVHWNARKYATFGEAAAAPDGLAVVGVFLEIGKEHASMNRLTDALYMVKFKGTKAQFRGFNPKCLLPLSLDYWTYLGSLTTPPLNESVTWIVLKEPIRISVKQLEKFRMLLFTGEEDQRIQMANNFRPPQPLKGRIVRASFKA
ncbi:carbonic anhydrase 7 [Passer montanus]|uniref:carbonic anhydrase 7 n=1 Tax=Passer montanus TaxID=9160 RepID=UPI001960826D|nr:carbonic anhydrase 7 [Passer montanus]